MNNREEFNAVEISTRFDISSCCTSSHILEQGSKKLIVSNKGLTVIRTHCSDTTPGKLSCQKDRKEWISSLEKGDSCDAQYRLKQK
jgi:hypothetical protein